jgi:hypothetical protein
MAFELICCQGWVLLKKLHYVSIVIREKCENFTISVGIQRNFWKKSAQISENKKLGSLSRLSRKNKVYNRKISIFFSFRRAEYLGLIPTGIIPHLAFVAKIIR